MDGNEQLNKNTPETVKVDLETAADKESEILDEASDIDFNDAVEITGRQKLSSCIIKVFKWEINAWNRLLMI